ncbi:MAG: hypothetical protein ACOYW3_17035 [Bacteroidota bacterium]
MKSKKILYLFLALLLPGLIFVFLKKFGKNEFNLPVYYTDGVTENKCGWVYSTPYVLPDSLWAYEKKKATLFVVSEDVEGRKNLKKLIRDFDQNEYTVAVVPSHLTQLRECVLLASEVWGVVLVDDKKQIRGYYDPTTREEIDRLRMEMSILLKKY